MAKKMSSEAVVESLLRKMSLADKIGQCVTFEFTGTKITPGLRKKILQLRCGGLRCTPHVYEALPYGVRKGGEGDTQRRAPWAGPCEYAAVINELQAMALSRRPSIPLHISVDNEGDFSADLGKGGVHLLPTQMGMRATGDVKLAQQGWRVLARQLKAAGVNMLHSPCVDIDFVSDNPAINTRSFADTPQQCARWGIAMMQALTAEGIIATAKHFPGRGFSRTDTHYGLDMNERTLEELMANEFYPYRELIKAGIPALLPSHTMYKAIDPEGIPASVSRRIHDFTRNTLGFNGVMATDAIGMAGVLKFCNDSLPKAARAALVAGNDLVLVKTTEDVEPLVIGEMTQALNEGEISLQELEDHVRRVLRMKVAAGLFERYPVNASRAMVPVRDEKNKATIAKLARKCCTLLCDEDALLPLKKDQKVLVVEPYYPLYQDRGNDYWWHSDMLQEFMRAYSDNVNSHEVINGGTQEDAQAIVSQAAGFDVVVVLCQKLKNPTLVAERLLAAGKKVVVVSCTPYRITIPQAARTVLVSYGMVPPILKNVAAVLYGKAKPQGQWPLENYRSPFDKHNVPPAKS